MVGNPMSELKTYEEIRKEAKGWLMNYVGSMVNGYIPILIGVRLENERILIQDWRDYGYGYKRKFNDYQFKELIKLAVNGELNVR